MKIRVYMISEDDGGYSVVWPEFNHLASCGDTREEALANFQEALDLALAPEPALDMRGHEEIYLAA